ncbi:phage portal protein [Heliobacillus mobilis]|uniref:Phage portal protein n=1 Tax=Heliobacterium mobile TaxID=28064 RepID=A0A6I3SC74_HELMO|nr:phage tail tube protein [Heliobacterium mobile]MTV47763.1 phage portal protein [Heliobacterium mobile]
MALDETRAISGTFGEVWREGNQMTQASEMQAKVKVHKADIKVSGDRWIGKKVVALEGTGSLKGFKVTSEMLQMHDPVAKNEKGYVKTELISKLDDPEAYGCERIRLKNVIFDEIPLVGWKVGEIVEEEWPFTFKGYELLDPIVES